MNLKWSVVVAVLVLASVAAVSPSPTLEVSFPNGTAVGTPYLITGCGYGSLGVELVVTAPTAIEFAGSVPDSNGCISNTDFNSAGPGHYVVDAYQQIHNGGPKTRVAETSFDL